MVVNVGRTLWHLCNTLRHDGMDYGQYLDQLTYLLFVKMALEQDLSVGREVWPLLRGAPNSELLETYAAALQRLGAEEGLIGDIYLGAVSEFSQPESLRLVINAIDEVHWGELEAEVQAEAFEYLLEQAAAEGKKGAGQYFTPRALIEVIVECVRPGSQPEDTSVADPAVGTGGFLVAAHRWVSENESSPNAFSIRGTELVPRPRRLALMNLVLSGVNAPELHLGDALQGSEAREPYSIVLTNPPFGVKGGKSPEGPGYWFATTNKQANFVQHVVSGLKAGGRAAIVLPDNCLFGDVARQLWPMLTELADVHTVLRLPLGSFAPYTAGTRTNVIFLTKGISTKTTWFYDARTGVRPAGRSNPLNRHAFEDFISCFGTDPNGKSERYQERSIEGRWQPFGVEQLRMVDFEFNRLADALATEIVSAREFPDKSLEVVLANVRRAALHVERAAALMKERGSVE